MRITPEFNRLYHGAFLKDLYEQMVEGKQIILTFKNFKMAIKQLNPDYPKDKDGIAVSTTVIHNKHLVQHIDFIIAWSGSYGITPAIIDEEWERTLQSARDY